MQTDKNDQQHSSGSKQTGKMEDSHVKEAFREAEKDIEKDPDLSIHHPNDDLDEAETARLGEGKNDLI